MSSCGVDHVFVLVSCLRMGLIMSLFRFHVFEWFHVVMSLSCLRVGFMSTGGFMSSCRFHLFAWFHVCLRVDFTSSRRFHIFVLFSDLRVALVSNEQRRFPANSFPLYLANDDDGKAAYKHLTVKHVSFKLKTVGISCHIMCSKGLVPKNEFENRMFFHLHSKTPTKHHFNQV